MRDYAKDLLDQGLLTRAEYERLLAARAADEAETHAKLAEASQKADERKRLALKGLGDGGVGWQADLDAWGCR